MQKSKLLMMKGMKIKKMNKKAKSIIAEIIFYVVFFVIMCFIGYYFISPDIVFPLWQPIIFYVGGILLFQLVFYVGYLTQKNIDKNE